MTPTITIATVNAAVLLSCSDCGPVGVYLCGLHVAAAHHLSTEHNIHEMEQTQ